MGSALYEPLDVTVVCGPESYALHSSLLSSKSLSFATMENGQRKVTITHVGPEMFRQVVGFIHGDSLDVGILELEELLAAADCFDVKALKLEICKMVKSQLETLDSSEVIKVATLVDRYNIIELQTETIRFLETNKIVLEQKHAEASPGLTAALLKEYARKLEVVRAVLRHEAAFLQDSSSSGDPHDDECLVHDLFQQVADVELAWHEAPDVTVLCGLDEHSLHSSLLSSKSLFFAAMLEAPMVEKEQRQVNLKDVDPKVFRKVVSHIYGHLFTMDIATELQGLLDAADRFDMESFKGEICTEAKKQLSTLDLEDVINAPWCKNHHNSNLRLKTILNSFSGGIQPREPI